MKVSITSIELRGPMKFFALSHRAMHIVKQLRSDGCVEYRSRGFWTKHYTMSLWKDEHEMRSFYTQGAHAEAMKASKQLAKELRFHTYDADTLPTWAEAKKALSENGRVIRH